AELGGKAVTSRPLPIGKTSPACSQLPIHERRRMTISSWRTERNKKSLARLTRALPEIFPQPVLLHALRQPLIPPPPRRAVESYWRHHPLRADRLARALAAASGAPQGWSWRIGGKRGSGLPTGFRTPPAPYREEKFAKGPGHCCIC